MQNFWEQCPAAQSMVVQYYDAKPNPNNPKLYMEFVHGWSLSEYLPLSDSPYVLAKLCEDLAFLLYTLYEHGIIYMDLTPENIIVTSPSPFDALCEQTPLSFKLIDFTFCEYSKYSYSFTPKRSSYHIDMSLDYPLRAVQVFAYFLARLFFKSSKDFAHHFDENLFIKQHPQFHMLFDYGFHPDASIHIQDFCKTFTDCLFKG